MMKTPLIEFHKATIYRGKTKVFDNLTLSISPNEPTVILGPNGAGKTTLLKVVTRELYPAYRENSWVRILGKERWNVWALRSQIGLVSHDLQYRYRPLTHGLDVVLSGYLSSIGIHGNLSSKIKPAQRKKARSLMEELDIAQFERTPLRQMSTGQQRRCLLARALVHNPDTLIFDEPTAGLDLAASFSYLSKIRALVEQGRNIILVTHHINEIPPYIERVILLGKGKIFMDGTKDQTLTEKNLSCLYGTGVRIAKIEGYYLVYPPT
tara:strand:+ start:1547 stop:2344 length:798 start_codon:yes stop_codon:yes gene_type:complete